MQSNAAMGGLSGTQSMDDCTTFWGYIGTVEDAMLLIEATNRGIYQRVTSRLHPRESISIRSGAVFVFDEEESKMKRWTDKLLWSPSRQVGNFFVYRQMVTKVPRGTRVKEIEAMSLAAQGGIATPVDPAIQAAERQYVGSLTSGPQYPRDGLVKKALAIGTLHVVSYFTLDDVMNGRLPTPSQAPELQGLTVSPRLESMANTSLSDVPPLRVNYQTYPLPPASSSPTYRSFSPYRPSPGRASTSPSVPAIPLRSDSHRSNSVPTINLHPTGFYHALPDQDILPQTSGSTSARPWGQLQLHLDTGQHTVQRRASDLAVGGPHRHGDGAYESWTLPQYAPLHQAATIPGFTPATFQHTLPHQPASLPSRSAPLDIHNLDWRSPPQAVPTFPSSMPTSFNHSGQLGRKSSSLGLVTSGSYSPPSELSPEGWLQSPEQQRQHWMHAPIAQTSQGFPEQVIPMSDSPSHPYGRQQQQTPLYDYRGQ